MTKLKESIRNLLTQKDHVVIAIDGRCGSGKSTLADDLAAEFDGAIIRMDHFFLPPYLRGQERVNVHYERFLEEVYPNLLKSIPFTYRIFDCSIMDYQGQNQIEMKPLLIIEGAYSLYPPFEDIYDLSIFCDIDENTQKKRIINRNGENGYKMFKEKWIPMEEAYFKEYDVLNRCDILVTLS